MAWHGAMASGMEGPCLHRGVQAGAVVDDEPVLADPEVLDAQIALRLPLSLTGLGVYFVGADGEAAGPQCSCLRDLRAALHCHKSVQYRMTMSSSLLASCCMGIAGCPAPASRLKSGLAFTLLRPSVWQLGQHNRILNCMLLGRKSFVNAVCTALSLLGPRWPGRAALFSMEC